MANRGNKFPVGLVVLLGVGLVALYFMGQSEVSGFSTMDFGNMQPPRPNVLIPNTKVPETGMYQHPTQNCDREIRSRYEAHINSLLNHIKAADSAFNNLNDTSKKKYATEIESLTNNLNSAYSTIKNLTNKINSANITINKYAAEIASLKQRINTMR